MIKTIFSLVPVLFVTGCMTNMEDFVSQPPVLTPVGSGLTSAAVPVDTGGTMLQPAGVGGDYSIWQDGASRLFRNPRAMVNGDVLTVHIQINDKASLDSSIDRSRDAQNKMGVGLGYGFNSSVSPEPFSLELDGSGQTNSATSTKGKGSIARSENIRLAVAAVVTRVLPNGNLLIKGSQEVRVNHEVRVLTIGGIVRPQDVTGENTISYDKIAEARISYGGRGRLDDVQKPGWGQRIFDAVTPF
ncbi:MAG: flagellar basal body L-ring protein FlgH [Rhizobiales bacterium]|nr:flagellar basal body L-ring protein FlgH [Hyphomicrobiales bacterium]